MLSQKFTQNSQECNYNSSAASILCFGLGWFPKTPGGLERYLFELTQQLAANHDFVELCGVGLPENEPELGIKLTNLATLDSSIWQRLWSIRTKFEQSRIGTPDAINLHFALYSLPILDILPKQVPITFNFHGPWASESCQEGVNQLNAFMKKWLVEKRVYNRCDRFIVLSKAFGNILHQDYQVSWDKINVIPGGVNIHKFKPNLLKEAARSQLGWQQDRLILFTSRRLVQRVGVDKLITALSIIKSRVPDILLVIGGCGSMQATLERQVTELGLDNYVKFLGFVPDEQLTVAYQAADLSVMPSQSFEGFCLALVESLACGTPVVCTPVGGMPEILQPFSPDLITTSVEATDIADKIVQLFSKEIPVPSREACHQYIANHFDWQKVAQQVRSVILA